MTFADGLVAFGEYTVLAVGGLAVGAALGIALGLVGIALAVLIFCAILVRVALI